MREKKTDPELPILLPFQPGPVSNGEYVPPDPTPAHLRMAAVALERAEVIAAQARLDRRPCPRGLGGRAVRRGAGTPPGDECGAGGKPRYRAPAQPALVRLTADGAEVRFRTAQRAIAPGQAAVFYQGDEVLGGGIIASAGRLTSRP